MLLTIYNTLKVGSIGHAYKAVKHITTKYDIIITDFLALGYGKAIKIESTISN